MREECETVDAIRMILKKHGVVATQTLLDELEEFVFDKVDTVADAVYGSSCE